MLLSTTERNATTSAAEPLLAIASGLIAQAAAGQKVQVVFDLDDTLVLVAPRKAAIFAELATLDGLSQLQSAALRRLASLAIPYDVKQALGLVGIECPDLVGRLVGEFFARFFDGRFLAHDVATPGAVSYVRHLHRSGVQVVYLTGRPATMTQHSAEALVALGFPLDGESARLMLKPDAAMGDAEFKAMAAQAIAAVAPVGAAFDNEPANLNAMSFAWADAHHVHLLTDGMPNPPALAMEAHAVPHFESPRLALAYAASASPKGLSGFKLSVREAHQA